MRTITTLAFLVIGASIAAVVSIRSATRIAVVRAMSKDGQLLICGDLSSVMAPWLSPDVHLYSTAPDGDLAIHRISATTKVGTPSRGAQSTSNSNATTVALGSDAARFEIDAGLDSADSGNTSVGYASENGTAIALPIRRFLFGAESNRLHVSVDPSAPGLFAPDLLSRGLYVAGEGWKRIDNESVDLVCGPGVSEGIGSQVNRCLADALRHLAAAGFPPPSRKPAVIVVDETREGAFARFDLPPESEVYVVQCRGGLLLESGVFRDLASDAVARFAAHRPVEERVLWTSFESALAVRLGLDAGLAWATEQLRAARRGYEGNDHLRYTPMHTPNLTAPFYWFIRESTDVHLWRLFFDTLERDSKQPWDVWTKAIADRPETVVQATTREVFGQAVADRFYELMETDRWQIPPVPMNPVGPVFPAEEIPPTATTSDAKPAGELTFVFTGVNLGFLDNCGCTKNQGGGVGRRKHVIDEVRSKHSDAIALDLGDTLSPPLSKKSRDAKANEALLAVNKAIGYDGMVPGIAELAHGRKWLQDHTAALGLRYFAANVIDRQSGALAFPPELTLMRNGRTLHVIGLVEVPYERYFVPAIEARVHPQYELLDVVDTAKRILASASRDETWCIAGTLTPESTERILALDGADRLAVILTCSLNIARVTKEDRYTGKMTVLKRPAQGLYGKTAYFFPTAERFAVSVGRVGLDATGAVVSATPETIEMPATVERDPAVEAILQQYASEQAGDPVNWPTTPLATLPEESHVDAGYVGVAVCATCHAKEAASWQQSKHSRALNALASKTKEQDVTCLRCHTTGFHWKDGYDPTARAPERFEQVQCEVCHGPGYEHARQRSTAAAMGIDSIRRAPTRSVCVSCHDDQNSPSFVYEAAIAQVRH